MLLYISRSRILYSGTLYSKGNYKINACHNIFVTCIFVTYRVWYNNKNEEYTTYMESDLTLCYFLRVILIPHLVVGSERDVL